MTGDPGVLDARDVAVAAVLAHVERFGATTRIRANGGRQHPDTVGLAVASFRQTTSREDDLQLHTHAAVSAKVQIADGWFALDARYLKRHRRMLGGLYQSVLRAELTERFGVAWDPIVNGQAEIAGMPQELLEVFSKPTRQIDAALTAKVDAFRQREGRDPTRWELAALTREAAADTRAQDRRRCPRSADTVGGRDRRVGVERRHGGEPPRRAHPLRHPPGHDDIVVGVDTHKHTHTAVAINSATGVQQQSWPCRPSRPAMPTCWQRPTASETCGGAGRSKAAGSWGKGLARWLAAHDEHIIEVDRPKRPARRNGANSDTIDALRAAREALGAAHHAGPRAGAARDALAALISARRSALAGATDAERQLLGFVTTAPELLGVRLRHKSTTRSLASLAMITRRSMRGTVPLSGLFVELILLRSERLGTGSFSEGGQR